jgi:hypothetical protein
MTTARNGAAAMLPFRTYEIPGALLSGFLILAACEAGYDGTWLIDREWNAERISLYGSMSLCIGLVVAALSRYLLERLFVGEWLSAPEEILLADVSPAKRHWKRALFPGYFAPLPPAIRESIPRRTGQSRVQTGSAIETPRFRESRFSASLQLATVCRTLCLGLLIVSLILVSGILWNSAVSGWGKAEWRKLGYCALSLFEAVPMMYRYLKYHRQHAIERLSRSDFPG